MLTAACKALDGYRLHYNVKYAQVTVGVELRFTLFCMYFRVMAAIFDSQHKHTSDSIPTCFSVFLTRKYSKAFGILLLSGI